MPKQGKRRVRSNCWYFYSKTADGGLCNMCKKEVRSTGNTTNLLNHLKRRHTQQYSEVVSNPEKYTVVDDDSHSGHEDDHKNDEVGDATRELEANHPHSMEAYQTDQGQTVIWLQSPVDQQSNAFQPQITIVQHAMENDGQQTEGETILGTGEIVSATSVADDSSAASEEHKTSAENNHTPNHRKTLVQNSTGKMSARIIGRSQLKPVRDPVKLVKDSPEVTNNVHKEDTYDNFGKYVASLLRNLSSKKVACRLQKDIVWLVLQEQMRE